MLIEGFTADTAHVNGQNIHFVTGGSGPAILLLHGFPQTHAMWHAVAPKLAQHYTVVASDMRGYGASSKPQGTAPYGFRDMAQDQLALMRHLGHHRFHLVGHDRGGRVAHRLALDAPDAPMTVTVMDIVPTHLLLDEVTTPVARAYYHWFFLAQPYPFPETLIGHDPDHFFESCLLGWGAAKLEDFAPEALDAYRSAWRDPDTIRGMCADYRAALDVDFGLDAVDLKLKVKAPGLVLYGADGAMAKAYDVPATWSDRFETMQQGAIAGGHFFIDQSPDETSRALLGFLQQYL